ncbi:GGDEF domain-containing protein [Fusibacter bizertensis]|uniref:GGDEF domain-containing protein n=1 Tax=Fusibacter bizertensis TaxID=1488331 RepID=A0ABT6ND05_9FIRM|nr:GGDEF domain-containing protein [Fusibacter bizertensis]MDH8678300.1 GGDEF domain-containing protein [Fusibacter bizertensis]
MKRKKSYIFSIVISLVALLGLIIFLSMNVNDAELKLADSEVYDLNDGWQITLDGKNYEDEVLPFKDKIPTMTTTYAWRILPKDMPEQTTLRFRASMQKIKVFLNDTLIFENQLASSQIPKLPEASAWFFVSLPNGSSGKKISLEIQSPVSSFSGLINTVYYGKSDALLYKTFTENMVSILVGIVLFIVGCISLIVSLFVKKLPDRRVFYLGLFAIFVSLWLLSEAKVMQFFTGNRLIVGGTSYMVLSLIPIPLLLYLRDTTLKKYYKFFYLPIAIFGSSFIINLSLQLLDVFHFIELISITNALMFLCLMVLIIVLFYESIVFKNNAAKTFLLSLIVMGVVLGFELYDYYTENYLSISSYTKFGILIFFGLLIGDSFRYINSMILKQSETNLYEKLAYIDILTGANNRTAFERDIHSAVRDYSNHHIQLILFDIDNLKQINDNYGHKAGDLAIMSTYECIQSVFENCYRIGGDEFACLTAVQKADNFEKMVVDLRTMMHMKSNDLSYDYELSVGTAVFEPGINTFDEVFEVADRRLYQDKKNKPVLK